MRHRKLYNFLNRRRKMRKHVALMMAGIMAASALTGCSQGSSETQAPAAAEPSAQETSAQADTSASSGEKEIVNYWHIHTGDEAKVEDELIAAYNASQDKYEVVGLSMNDQQKLIVAMSSNEGPDVIFSSNANLTTYYYNGLLKDLQEYVDRDQVDLSQWTRLALEACTFDGDLYAMPESGGNQIMMYYNKDLLKEAGYEEPPETMEELYEMAEKITTLDENGDIDVLGYPLFPFASARQELVYAFGGRWWDDDGNLTPDSQGILDSLHMNMQFREKYGIEKVQAFVGTANTNRYTEQDMFFTGKLAFRFDGNWLTAMIMNNNPDLNFGITMVPGTKDHPENRGVSRYEAGTVAMPVNAKCKEGAWDFIKFASSFEGSKILDLGRSATPARFDLMEDADILAMPGQQLFIEASKLENGINYPKIKDYAKYVSLIDNALDLVYNGYQSPEDAMKDLAEQCKSLQ